MDQKKLILDNCNFFHSFQFGSPDFFKNLAKFRKIAGIYGIWCEKTQKVYIGVGIDLYYRCKSHLNYSYKSNKNLQADIKTYGIENFHFVIFELVKLTHNPKKDSELLRNCENHYLQFFPREMLYNCRFRGTVTLGWRHSQKTRAFLSETLKTKNYSVCGSGLRSPEVIEKLKAAKKGNLNPNWGKGFSLFVTSTDSSFAKLYYGFRSISQDLGISTKTVEKYLKNGLVYHKKGVPYGYRFKYTPCTLLSLEIKNEKKKEKTQL